MLRDGMPLVAPTCPRSLLVALVAAASACGGDDVSISDAAPVDAAADLSAAPDLSLPSPTVPKLTAHGGPVLAAPEPWVVVWAGDETLGDELDAFHRDLFAAYVWDKTMMQYGVQGGRAMGEVVLPDAKPSTLARVDVDAIVNRAAASITRTMNSVVVLVVPRETTLTGVPENELGFHTETVGGLPFVVLRQTTKPTYGSTTFEDLTYFASHELAEAALNPRSHSSPAFYDDDLGPQYGEIADECNPTSQYIYAVSDGGMPSHGLYLAARLYSNSAATGTTDPCWAPQMGPYFYVGAVPRTLTGSTASTDLEVVATGDVGMVDWDIAGAPAGVTIAPQQGTNAVGDRVHVTVTTGAGVSASYPLVVEATSQKTGATNLYWLLVTP